MNKFTFALHCIIAFITISCSSETNYCNLPETKLALKEALILDMEDWKRNAKYASIDDFQKEVNKIVQDIKIIETSYVGGNEKYFDIGKNGTNICRCKSIIRFKDHEKYKQIINGPVTKVRAEEHPLNSAYLRLEEQMNYLDNDGFMFSYIVIKKKEKTIQVPPYYPLPLETNIDNAGGLIFDYIKRFKEQVQ